MMEKNGFERSYASYLKKRGSSSSSLEYFVMAKSKLATVARGGSCETICICECICECICQTPCVLKPEP